MKLKSEAKYYFWDDPYLWRMCSDQVIRRCIPEWEQKDVLNHCHALACGGHFGPRKTARKVLDSGFYWPTLNKDSFEFCQVCERCQLTGGISRRDEMPQNPIIVCEIFDVWGMDFMGPIPYEPIFIWEYIHFDYGGLCIQMDRSKGYTHLRVKGGS